MLKYYLILFFFVFFHDATFIIASINKEKFYYNKTLPSATETRNVSKNKIPIMEGQSHINMNVLKSIVKKESKTVPRKGVLNKMDEVVHQNITFGLDSALEKSRSEKKNSSTSILEINKEILAKTLKISTSTESTSAAHVAPVREVLDEQDIKNVIKQKTAKKPKPKPEVTIGGKEADDPIPASPTIKSHLGIPRKIDYIVPAIITITALPLLGVSFYVLYKRGRDYWDKRHYRRMDFLIDGMYNE